MMENSDLTADISGVSNDNSDAESKASIGTAAASNVGNTSSESNGSALIQETTCWVCFATVNDDPNARWVHPCRCRGTAKWVHQSCIQRWVDEKQHGNMEAPVECPQCSTQYRIAFPTSNFLIVAGSICAGSLYWSAITYGAISLMQSMGHTRGLMLLERTDPIVLIISLPLIPVGLVLGKMLKWEDPVLDFLRKQVPRTRITRLLLPPFATEPIRQAANQEAGSITRTICGALFLPSISTVFGGALYESQPLHWKRSLYGGATYLLLKGAIKIYYRQMTFIRQCDRIILNFEEEENP